ncbi:GGDEF domain-containing protein [Vibrio sp. SCSIO 43153]|uniref:GGDEF domain-containing protein n=1 Tax=Vibrio TaxID=662 RepID=UPI002075037B|nr:GGDEF domain-containing protein [Vibrio sp. SCSIO 43153]USD51599.1 GGDEF domain-containing protein [Vibrio sp. SCSIO 43153]
MSKLAGARLEEMADIHLTRQKKITFMCSFLASMFMSYGLVAHYNQGSYGLSVLNGICALGCLINCYAIRCHDSHSHSDLILSALLICDGLLLFFYNDSETGKLLWLYPILATLILINEFKLGLILNGIFVGLIIIASNLPLSIFEGESYSYQRFVFSLIAASVICHTFAYYYSKVILYIQNLYREGIEELAYLDQLTGLANRWSFEKWARSKLEEVDAQGRDKVTALVFLDIDDFKLINDSYGHDVGDQVLQHFATRLKNSIRNKDRNTNQYDYSIARFAGDEFVIMLYDVRSKKDLNNILSRIVNLFHGGYHSCDSINEITMSVGVAIYRQDAHDLSELTRCADKAMYTAKHTGKNRFAFYEDCSQNIQALKESHSLLGTMTQCSNVTPLSRKSVK